MEQSSPPQKPEPLRFEPDLKRLEKLARFRRWVLYFTLGAMVIALVWMIFLPSKIVNVNMSEEGRRVSEQVLVPEGAKPVERVRQVEPEEAGKQDELAVMREAEALVTMIDASVGRAIEQWQRAEAMVNAISLREENLKEILQRIGVAKVVGESAEAGVKSARESLARLQGFLKYPGLIGLRVNSAYSVARDFLSLVEEEAKDRRSWLDYYEQAVRAWADGDLAEFDIKNNVADGYKRKFGVRAKRISRAGRILHDVKAGLR